METSADDVISETNSPADSIFSRVQLSLYSCDWWKKKIVPQNLSPVVSRSTQHRRHHPFKPPEPLGFLVHLSRAPSPIANCTPGNGASLIIFFCSQLPIERQTNCWKLRPRWRTAVLGGANRSSGKPAG